MTSCSLFRMFSSDLVFFFQAEDGIRDKLVTGVQTCALPISLNASTSMRTRMMKTETLVAFHDFMERPSSLPTPVSRSHERCQALSLNLQYLAAVKRYQLCTFWR